MAMRIPLRSFQVGLRSSTPIRQIHSTRNAFRPNTFPRLAPRSRPAIHQQLRHAGSFVGNAGKLFRKHPFSMTLATGCVLFGAWALMYVNWFYFNNLALTNYPEEVAKQLRRAIYFSTFDFRPDKAVKYYKDALEAAKEVGMNYWSDEVIGIKIKVMAIMERLEQYDKQITALEVIRRDCLTQSEKYKSEPAMRADSTRLLKWGVSISVKLGELYSKPEVWSRENAEKHLSWAVEAMVRERLRRDHLKISEQEEGPWMSNEDIAVTVENLATTYEAQDQHYVAAPLFLHAINLVPTKTCHTVVLMNNLASSLSQQSPRAAAIAQAYAADGTPTPSSTVPVSREMLLGMAETWANNALDVAAEIAPPARTEECDTGCAVALHNLGEIAEMLKNQTEAKKRYREAISLARAIGFKEGVEHSTARLNALEKVG